MEDFIMFKNAEEIAKSFIKKGWGKDTSFSELSIEEAEKIGNTNIISGMKKGKKYFKMNICKDIYDENCELIMFDMPTCKGQPVEFW